jgi:hypothetical protein
MGTKSQISLAFGHITSQQPEPSQTRGLLKHRLGFPDPIPLPRCPLGIFSEGNKRATKQKHVRGNCCRVCVNSLFTETCRGTDSNRYLLRDQILSLARLPISPPRLKSNANNATSAMIANNFRWPEPDQTGRASLSRDRFSTWFQIYEQLSVPRCHPVGLPSDLDAQPPIGRIPQST